MEFKIKRNPYGTKSLYSKSSISFDPGLTVLVGPNGSGKSTLLRQLKRKLEEAGEVLVYFDNLRDGGRTSTANALYRNDFNFAASTFNASEGEVINQNLNLVVGRIGGAIRKVFGGEEEKRVFVLLDAIDSGLSVDNIVEMKDFLTDTVFPDAEDKGVEVYVIAAANEYELCRGSRCLDVKHMEYVVFGDYEEYRKFILGCSKKKKVRKAGGKHDNRSTNDKTGDLS